MRRCLLPKTNDTAVVGCSGLTKPTNPPKRGRGRPRKLSISASDDSSGSDDDIAPLNSDSSGDEETFSDLDTVENRPTDLHVGDFHVTAIPLESGKVPVKHYVGCVRELDLANGRACFEFYIERMAHFPSSKSRILTGFRLLMLNDSFLVPPSEQLHVRIV